MIEHTLHIGDVVTSSGDVYYTCVGLGSCIGLFIHDRTNTLSAGAHILLPENEKGPTNDPSKCYNVTSAIRKILAQLQSRGSSLESLRAKIVGGANVLRVNTFVGLRNIESVSRQLTENKIYLAASDVGGVYSRTARFESSTGLLTVRMPELNEYKIF